jgi:tetratricopeptide (TPR) repeat protein
LTVLAVSSVWAASEREVRETIYAGDWEQVYELMQKPRILRDGKVIDFLAEQACLATKRECVPVYGPAEILDEGILKDVRKWVQKLSLDNLDNPHVLYLQAAVEAVAGEVALATEMFTLAIEKEDKYALAHVTRGLQYSAKNLHGKAIDDYDRAIELDPEFTLAYIHRGMTHARLGRDTKALADLDKALTFGTYQAFIYGQRAAVYLGQKKYQPAVDDYTTVLEMDSTAADMYYNRAEAYSAMDKYEEAINDYKAFWRHTEQNRDLQKEIIAKIKALRAKQGK